ncbi:MAG: hypothetical protein OEY64_12105 [Nitrospinota bacterium]|nr:hypothetical protein [Nitrospinota bacterium]
MKDKPKRPYYRALQKDALPAGYCIRRDGEPKGGLLAGLMRLFKALVFALTVYISVGLAIIAVDGNKTWEWLVFPIVAIGMITVFIGFFKILGFFGKPLPPHLRRAGNNSVADDDWRYSVAEYQMDVSRDRR